MVLAQHPGLGYTGAMKQLKANEQLPYADAFRAAAIFFVFWGHIAATQHALTWHHLALEEAVPFDGVAMLFVLSGFLLSRPFMNAFLDGRPLPLFGQYFLARALRIYPLYFVCVAVFSMVLILRHAHLAIWDVISHVLLLQGLSASSVQSLSGPLWTMSVDASFYVFLPLLFVAAAIKRPESRERRAARLLAVLATLVVLCVIYRFAAVALFRPGTYELGLVTVSQLPGMLASFMLGVLARYAVDHAKWVRNLSRPSIVLIFALALLCRVLFLVAHTERLHLVHLAHWQSVALLWSLEDPVSAAGAALVLMLVGVSSATSLVHRVLSIRAFTLGAALSYAFYLVHLPVLQSIDRYLPHGSAASVAIELAVSLAVLLPICAVLHVFVERPFLVMKRSLKREHGGGLPDPEARRHQTVAPVSPNVVTARTS